MPNHGYYDRQITYALDGARLFATPEDRRIEDEVAFLIGQYWQCELRRFGGLTAIDWYAIRDQRLIGIAEFKSRAHESTRYDTVWLNVRKWLALTMASAGLGVPALFIVKFTDVIKTIRIADVDARRVRMGGCGQSRMIDAVNDIEPVIDVPIKEMHVLKPCRTYSAAAPPDGLSGANGGN